MRMRTFSIAAVALVAAVFDARAARVILQDNTLYDYSGTADAWLNEASASRRRNYGGARELQVRYDANDGGFIENCTVIKFALPVVVSDGVSAAELALFYRTAGSMLASNVMGIKPYRLTADWYENTHDGSSGEGVSWRYRDKNETLPWTHEAGGWSDKVDDGNGTNRVKRAGGSGSGIEPLHWVPFNVLPTVQQWYGGAANHGFVLFSCSFEGGGSMVYAEFDSREVGTAADRPKLTLTYQNAQILWEGHINGNWNDDTLNWRVGGVRGFYGDGDHVTFDGGTRTNIVVAAGGVAPGSVTFSNASSRITLSGGSVGGSGGVSKYRAGEARLAAGNAYTGATTVYDGRLIVGANHALGSTASGTAVHAGGALVIEGGVHYTAPEPLSLAGHGGDGQGALRSTAGTSSFAGNVTLGANAAIGVPAGAELSLLGILQGTADWAKVGDGRLVLGAGNAYSGTATVSAGILRTTAVGALPSGGNVALANAPGVALELHGSAQTLGSLDGGGPAGGNVDLGGADLTVARGIYGGSIHGSGTLTKTGPDTLILRGNNTYSGTTTVVGGILRAGAADALPSGGNVALADAPGVVLDLLGYAQTLGGLDGGGAAGGNVDLGGANLTVARGVYGGSIHGPGTLTKTGPGSLTLQGNNTYAGSTTISDGILQIGAGGTTGWISSSVVNDGQVVFNRSDDVEFDRSIGGSGSLRKEGAGMLTLSGPLTYQGDTQVNAGVLRLRAVHAGPGTYHVGNPMIAKGGTLSGTGVIGGNVFVHAAGTLAPGDSIGTLDVLGDVRIQGVLRIELGGGGPGSVDLLNVGQILDISEAKVVFDVLKPLTDLFYVFAAYGELEGEFATATGLPPGFSIDYNHQGLNRIALVPEPSLAMFAAVASLFCLARRRRR